MAKDNEQRMSDKEVREYFAYLKMQALNEKEGDFNKSSVEQVQRMIELLKSLDKSTFVNEKLSAQYKKSSDYQKQQDELTKKNRLREESNFKAYMRQSETFSKLFIFSDFSKKLKTAIQPDNVKYGAARLLTGAGLLGNYGPKITEELKGFKEFKKDREEKRNDVEMLKTINELHKGQNLTREQINILLKREGASDSKRYDLLNRYQEQLKKEREDFLFANSHLSGEEVNKALNEMKLQGGFEGKDKTKPESASTQPDWFMSNKENPRPSESVIDFKEEKSGVTVKAKALDVLVEETKRANALSEEKIEQDYELEMWRREHPESDKKEKKGMLSTGVSLGVAMSGLATTLLGGIGLIFSEVLVPLVVIGTAIAGIGVGISKVYDWWSNSTDSGKAAKKKNEDMAKWEDTFIREKGYKRDENGALDPDAVDAIIKARREKWEDYKPESAEKSDIPKQIDMVAGETEKKKIEQTLKVQNDLKESFAKASSPSNEKPKIDIKMPKPSLMQTLPGRPSDFFSQGLVINGGHIGN
jgi:hypothetical protein